MAVFKTSLCVCSLLCAGLSGVKANDVVKQGVPNGQGPFSIHKSVNPLEKVISMLQKITDQVHKEADDEEKVYSNFACFCKDRTGRLEKHVQHHASEIDLSSSDIADWTAQTNDLHVDLQKRKGNQESHHAEKDDYERRLDQAQAKYQRTEATFNTNKDLVKKALNSLTGAKRDVSSSAFLQVQDDSLARLKPVLSVADAMGLLQEPKRKALASSLLQVCKRDTGGSCRFLACDASRGPTNCVEDPFMLSKTCVCEPGYCADNGKCIKAKEKASEMEQYEFHDGSNDIITLVKSLWEEMKDQFKTDTEEHERAVKSYKEMIKSLTGKIASNDEAMAAMSKSASRMKKDTAEARLVLIENKGDLKETEEVLKRVTSACTSRADEYAARTKARGEELAALQTAMNCLTNAHKGAKEMADKYENSLLQGPTPLMKLKALPKPQDHKITAVKANVSAKVDTQVKAKAKAVEEAGTDDKYKALKAELLKADASKAVFEKEHPEASTKPISFLQEIVQNQEASSLSSAEKDQRKKKALDVIFNAGRNVKSLMLTSLAATSEDDPFSKVKQLISDLRWRLEKEEHAEVEKHVWCAEHVEKATHERDARFENVNFISRQVHRLDARIEKLKASIVYHTKKAKEIGSAIVKIYTDVAQLSAEQSHAMEVQREARDEIREAILTLRSYYSQAGKASSGALVQVSKPDGKALTKLEKHRLERRDIYNENEQRAEDEVGREKGRKKRAAKRMGDLMGENPSMGRSGSLGDAIALMETIESDFTREIGNLEGDLDAEHRELVKTNQILLTQKEHAEELCELDKQDLETAVVAQATKFDDMQTNTNLLDAALKELETLKPTCIDTGMSYSERVKMRETEMEALKKALCILGETDEQYGCPPEE